MLLKKKKAKSSKRGFYLADRVLKETVFKEGSHYKYVLDTKNRKMVILEAEDKGNKVSRKIQGEDVKPLIDIRSKDFRELFNDCDYLQIEIYGDQILVEGYQENKNSLSKMSETIKNLVQSKKKKIVDIQNILNVKKKVSVVLSSKKLQQAVGLNYEQLTLFDDILETSASVSSNNIIKIQDKLKNVHIPLLVSSLFSGAGMMDMGFKALGYEICFALEIDKDACQTYRSNIGDHIVQGDITMYPKDKIAKAPVMIGGSPCQGFSNSNRYTNFLDNPNNKLVKEFIDAVKANENCQVFVLENVPQIMTAGNGQFKREIYETLSDFEISSSIISSIDFNGYQDRKRSIFVGSKIGKIELPKSIPDARAKTVREAFEGLHDGIPNQLDISDAKSETLERIKHIPPGGNVHNIPASIRPKGTHSDFYKRLEWDKNSITIVNPRKSMILHPEEDRILSVRECARLFGLNDDFVFLGSKSSKQQQVANGVPMELSMAVARVIKEAIEMFNLRNREESLSC